MVNTQVNTKEMSYMLGFIWADGYLLNRHHKEIRIECVREDIEAIRSTFNKTISWNISYRNRSYRKPQATLQTSNRHLFDFLYQHGYGAKTNGSATAILNLIPENLRQFWFRGLIDGDGCWYINKRLSLRQFSVSSCFDQDWSYLENLLNTLNIQYKTTKRIQGKNKHSVVRVTGFENLIKLGSYIYDSYADDHIGLQRKYNKWIEIRDSYHRDDLR